MLFDKVLRCRDSSDTAETFTNTTFFQRSLVFFITRLKLKFRSNIFLVEAKYKQIGMKAPDI